MRPETLFIHACLVLIYAGYGVVVVRHGLVCGKIVVIGWLGSTWNAYGVPWNGGPP